MATPRFEVLSGTVDGVNTTFTVSNPYLAGSIAVFVDGLLIVGSGWVETDPVLGVIDFNVAPTPGSVLQAFYLDTSPAVLDTKEVCPLVGRIEATAEIDAVLLETEILVGKLSFLS